MTTARSATAVALLAAMAVVSGCMTGGQTGGGGPLAPAQNSVAISRFSGGIFETTAADTGNKLADGSYRYTDARTVEITVVSLIRQTTTTVACSLATSTQLNCTSSTGQNFVLTRYT